MFFNYMKGNVVIISVNKSKVVTNSDQNMKHFFSYNSNQNLKRFFWFIILTKI